MTVAAVPGEDAFTVAGYRIEAPGWHTFRFLFSEEGGSVDVDLVLEARRGGRLVRVDDLPPVALTGPFHGPFEGDLPVDEYGSAHLWFFDAPVGLALPIDEHRVRRGR